MGWARLDDNRHDHPKVLNLGDDLYALAAVGLLDHAITWASRHRRGSTTPGLVPWSFWQQRGGRHTKRLVGLLVRERLVDADQADRGVWIHDFDDYGPKRDSAEASAAGKKGAASRWQKPSDSDGKSQQSAMANDGSRASACASPTRPDPTRPKNPQVGSSSEPSVAPPVPLPPPLDHLHHALTTAGIDVAWDLARNDQAAVAAAVDRVGIPALVKHAQKRHQPNSPAFSVKAFVVGWTALQPRPLTAVPEPAQPCTCGNGYPDRKHCPDCRRNDSRTA